MKYKDDFHKAVELGIGYFTAHEEGVQFETFAGAGYGQINAAYSRTFDAFFEQYIIDFIGTVLTSGYYHPSQNNNSSYSDEVRAIGSYNTQFVQTNFSVPTNGDFYFSLSAKITRVGFNDYKEELKNSPGNYIKLNVPSQIMFQPAVTLISKGKIVRAFVQLSYVGGIDENAQKIFSWQHLCMASGITLKFNAGKK